MLCVRSADATTVTIGQPNLAQFGETFTCGKAERSVNETLVQISSSGVDTVPAPGVITSWALLGIGRFDLRVLERTGEFFIGAGTSESMTSKGGGEKQSSTELPVATGDRIGVDMLDAGDEMGVGATGEAGARILTFTPIVEEGHAAEDPVQFTGERLMLNAQEELTPIVTSVSPASGSTAGGDTVTITGKYLDSARNVIFGTRPATSWSVDLAGEHIIAETPASPASTVEVHVSNLHSTSEQATGDLYAFVTPATTGAPAATTTVQGGPASVALQVSAFTEAAGRWRLGSALPHIAGTRSARVLPSSSTSRRTWLSPSPASSRVGARTADASRTAVRIGAGRSASGRYPRAASRSPLTLAATRSVFRVVCQGPGN